MHVLAYCYHWTPDILWDMPISERKMWCKMIMTQKEAERKAIEKN